MASDRHPQYALGLLLVVFSFNHVDRQVLTVLIDPIARELDATDGEMGLLAGFAFALFYTLAGFPLARWADRGTRRNIIALALAFWSTMTALSGLVQNYTQMLLARIGVGAGEAGCNPSAHSLISDFFPPERRALAFSIYSMGIALGTIVGLPLAGWIAELYGWRAAFITVGLPGLLLAVVVRLTLREPIRGQSEHTAVDQRTHDIPEVAAFVWRLHSLRHVIFATSLQTLGIAAALSWHPTFLIRVHGMSTGEAGTWLGIIVGAGGAAGTFGAGWLADRLGALDARWPLRVLALAAAGSAPFAAAFYLGPAHPLTLGLLVPAVLLHHGYAGLGHAIVQSLVKVRMRAVASALTLFMMNLVGFGIGPPLVGVSNDLLAERFGPDAIRYSLLWSVAALLWSALHYRLAERTLLEDLHAKEA